MSVSLPPAARRRLRMAVTTAVTRLRPAAPPPVWEALMAARSVVGGGPLVAPPAFRRALVVAPHPDDETIGCGATAALMADAGARVEVLVASSGEASVITPGSTPRSTAATRQAEARAACAALGVSAPHFAGLPDGHVGEDIGRLTAAIGDVVAAVRPQAVFVPWPLDAHPDHRAVPEALAAVDLDESIEVWCYEVWAALPANRVVDVTSVWEKKLAALACHLGRDAFDLDAHLALQRWRSIFGLDGFGHAEAFLVLTPAQLRALIGGPRP